MRLMTARLAIFVLWLGSMIVPAAATAPCGGDFGTWLEGLKEEAAAQGVSQSTIQSALSGVTYDPNIIARDHAQDGVRVLADPPQRLDAQALPLGLVGVVLGSHFGA